MEGRLTKKERKEQRKLEELNKMQETSSSNKMKWIVVGLASILFLAFFVFAIVASKQKSIAPIKLSSSGWATGNLQSKVTFVEFGDFQCPACGAFEPTFAKIVKDYGKKIKVVFKEFPLPANVHPNSMVAAIAAEAAGEQGKFWEYHNVLYAKQGEWSPLTDPTNQFVLYAKNLKLDIAKFKKDLSSKNLSAKIDIQKNEGINAGINSTPSVLINGILQQNRDYSALSKEIDKLLSR